MTAVRRISAQLSSTTAQLRAIMASIGAGRIKKDRHERRSGKIRIKGWSGQSRHAWAVNTRGEGGLWGGIWSEYAHKGNKKGKELIQLSKIDRWVQRSAQSHTPTNTETRQLGGILNWRPLALSPWPEAMPFRIEPAFISGVAFRVTLPHIFPLLLFDFFSFIAKKCSLSQ